MCIDFKMQCERCEKSFKTIFKLHEHTYNRKTPCRPATHHCFVCTKGFASYQSLWNHKRRCKGKFANLSTVDSIIGEKGNLIIAEEAEQQRTIEKVVDGDNQEVIEKQNSIKSEKVKAFPASRLRKPNGMFSECKETNRCTFCATTFSNKKKLLKHLKERHDILQPYQCISCLKRFASYTTLCIHRKSYCKMTQIKVDNVNQYTLPGFLANVRTENWIPTYGDVLTCCTVDEEVQIFYAGNLVGEIPQPLRTTFADFLRFGTIHVKVAGAVINRGYGEKVPVDYMFISSKHNVHNVILELELC